MFSRVLEVLFVELSRVSKLFRSVFEVSSKVKKVNRSLMLLFLFEEKLWTIPRRARKRFREAFSANINFLGSPKPPRKSSFN